MKNLNCEREKRRKKTFYKYQQKLIKTTLKLKMWENYENQIVTKE